MGMFRDRRRGQFLLTGSANLRCGTVDLDWCDAHLDAFWLSGNFWGDHAGAFATPGSAREIGFRSARIRLYQLGLEVGQTLACVFDFGDEWRVRLKLSEIRPALVTALPRIVDSQGDSPLQYGWDDANVA